MPAADKATRFVKLLTATAAEVLETITSEEKAALELQLSTLTAEEVCVCVHTHVCSALMYVLACIQWNFSIINPIGTHLAVLYREGSLIQREICTQALCRWDSRQCPH